jgi:hypothetical protein
MKNAGNASGFKSSDMVAHGGHDISGSFAVIPAEVTGGIEVLPAKTRWLKFQTCCSIEISLFAVPA